MRIWTNDLSARLMFLKNVRRTGSTTITKNMLKTTTPAPGHVHAVCDFFKALNTRGVQIDVSKNQCWEFWRIASCCRIGWMSCSDRCWKTLSRRKGRSMSHQILLPLKQEGNSSISQHSRIWSWELRSLVDLIHQRFVNGMNRKDLQCLSGFQSRYGPCYALLFLSLPSTFSSLGVCACKSLWVRSCVW